MEKITQRDIRGLCKDHQRDNLRFLYPDDYFALFSVVPNPKHQFNLKFLFGTGVRIGEAQEIRVRDINFDRRQITILKSKRTRKGKTTKGQRKVNFSTQFRSEIKQWISLNKLDPDDTLGILTRQQLDPLIKFYGFKAGIREPCDLRTHTCRKTHETYLVAMGVDSMTISLHMGHTIDTALRYYVTSTFSQEDVLKAKMIMGDIF